MHKNEFEVQFEEQEETLTQENKDLDTILREIAEEEGMTFEETKALFRKGLKQSLNTVKPVDYKAKAKAKAKKKLAKKSRKRNR